MSARQVRHSIISFLGGLHLFLSSLFLIFFLTSLLSPISRLPFLDLFLSLLSSSPPYLLFVSLIQFPFSSPLFLFLHLSSSFSTFKQYRENQEAQTQFTYVCDDTLDPTFLGQKFLFSVNERAANEPRQYRIRVVVKTKENLRVNRFLGMADIHLTCLRNEQEIEVKSKGSAY